MWWTTHGQIDVSGLNNFVENIKKYKAIGNISNELSERVAQRGVEIAKEEYTEDIDLINETVMTAKVYLEDKGVKGEKRIVASGKRLRYREFGTGLVGEGTYPGKLPTQTFRFNSPKDPENKVQYPQVTDGWEYYYTNKRTKVLGGWFTGKTFHTGQKAQHQMYTTAKTLKSEIPQIARDLIKERQSK